MTTIDEAEAIGASAGAIWGVLACNGPVSLDWLRRATKLTEAEANRGIGWLAREGKLSLEHRARRREARVASAAEHVRRILASRGPMLAARISQATALPEDLAQQSLGWLAREGRVAVRRRTDRAEIKIGEAAGIVWRLVHSRGTVVRRDIPKATGLSAGLANEAIGWLVREGKLVVEDRDETRPSTSDSSLRVVAPAGPGSSPPDSGPGAHPPGTMGSSRSAQAHPPPPRGTLTLETKGEGPEVPIGEAAGSVWRALHRKGHLSWKALRLETRLSTERLNQGFGWLAREGKLHIGRNRKGHELFGLNDA